MYKAEKYYLVEIARHACKCGFGGPGAILEALRSGFLVTHVFFPTYDKRPREVSKGVWESMRLDDFFTSKELCAEGAEACARDFTVSGLRFFAREREKLSSIPYASRHKDTTLIDADYYRLLEKGGVNFANECPEMWCEVMNLYNSWRDALEGDKDEEFSVYVLDEEWPSFLMRIGADNIPEKLPKRGRPPNEFWGAIYEEAFRRLVSQLGYPGGSKTQFLKELHAWCLEEFGANGAPKYDTLTRHLPHPPREQNRKSD